MPRFSATAVSSHVYHSSDVAVDNANRGDRRPKIRHRNQRQTMPLAFFLLLLSFLCIFISIRHRQTQTQRIHYHRLQRAQQMVKLRAQQHHRHHEQQQDDVETTPDPAVAFAALRKNHDVDPNVIPRLLERWLKVQDRTYQHNSYTAERWTRPYLLPPLPDGSRNKQNDENDEHPHNSAQSEFHFAVSGTKIETRMAWEDELQEIEQLKGPPVDYTNTDMYTYPELQASPEDDDHYPPLQTLQRLMENWPQDEDFDGAVYQESLLHFNYSNPEELSIAERFRDAELPFKLYNIPDIDDASEKWTDEYLSQMFGTKNTRGHSITVDGVPFAIANGRAQESTTNFFAFFVPLHWYLPTFGLPPTRNNDWDFATWARHARYADSVRLGPGHPHFYWQSGVKARERLGPEERKSFITRDLPLLSDTKPNFVVFHPESQKGIQCRFGERGVVAATHYDGGRNMVAMVTGAKRYILSPPNQCSRLGIFTERTSPIYRHSLLNFGHLNGRDDASGMSPEEQAWLDRAADSQAVETVLKAGEILYIPSHWFHYIVSVQKSAQCNVRSGVEHEGNPRFGGRETVEACVDPELFDTTNSGGAREY